MQSRKRSSASLANKSLILLTVIAIIVSVAYVYVHFFVKDITTGTNYIDNQIGVDILNSEDLTEEEKNKLEDRYFLEANFYSNSKNNGIALQELKLNYFMDYNLTSSSYRSTGMQYLGDLKQSDLVLHETSTTEANKYQSSLFSYYDTVDGVSWSGNKLNTQLNRESSFVVKIDNRPFLIQLTGTYEWKTYEPYFLFWQKEITNIQYYTYLNVFADCMQAIRSNSYGFGDYYIVADLSEYFSVREFDSETGKYKEDNVSDILKNYAVLKFHYDENGALNSSQSLFKTIDCNPNYGMNEDLDTSYWQERVLYNLDESILSYRYSELYEGYLVSISQTMKTTFNELPRNLVNLKIDLNSSFLKENNLNIVGIDYNGFENFKLNKLTIVGVPQKLVMLEKSLFETDLKTLEYSAGMTFNFSENVINSEYAEVIL